MRGFEEVQAQHARRSRDVASSVAAPEEYHIKKKELHNIKKKSEKVKTMK